MLILHDPATLSHSTIELLGSKLIPALESPSRITAILHSLESSSVHSVRNTTTTTDALTESCLSRTHDDGYIAHLRTAHSSWVAAGNITSDESILPECFPFPSTSHQGRPDHPPKDLFARAGHYAFDMSTGISAETWTSALASANLAVEGVRAFLPHSAPPPAVKSVPPSTVLALCRPPGHHCDTKRAGGYCYINNAVVAVEAYRQLRATTTPERRQDSMSPNAALPPVRPQVAILDLDFHHGNGTQESSYADPDVLYVSVHGEDEYPYYTGSVQEKGVGDGHGMNVNLPLKAGSGFDAYKEKLAEGLGRIEEYGPELVVISLGFDTYTTDPLGSFKIETEDYEEMAAMVARSVHELAQRGREEIPALILLEGGYVIEKLGDNLLSFLRGWEKKTRTFCPGGRER